MRVHLTLVSVLLSWCILLGAFPSSALRADDSVPADPPLRWWKGNIHTHSLWSDGNDFPEMIAEWYRERGYNFLALSDHNVLSNGNRWMRTSAVEKRGDSNTLKKYEERFGGGWVEFRGEGAQREVRLKPLSEFRPLVEERGKFLMLQAEEITDSVQGKPVHMNATNIEELIQPLSGENIVAAIEANFRAARVQAEKTGREVLVHLNHPNFHYAITAEEIAQAVSERHFEVYNGHPGVNHLGDEYHPSLERLWDIANTIRLGKLSSPMLYGVATDDSHVYHGASGSRPGRGWIMVRSRYLTPEHIVHAVNQGDFYCSSGVTLTEVSYTEGKSLELGIDVEPGVTYTTRFVGTLKDYDDATSVRVGRDGSPSPQTTRVYSADVGRELAVSESPNPRYEFSGNELFVRAVVTSSNDHVDPSFKGQKQQAWTQPVQP